MLVDFQKAFDSVSWDFLSDVLKFFNFGKDFIKWICVLNKNVQASILQSGYLSKFFTIQRGCRQGDPIAPYLFLLCAQILCLMVLYNNSIKGIHIGDKSYKITQFADDTSIFLDGEKESLLAALNTLEIFGSISGLTVNTDKTKLVWMGKKRHSKDKIESQVKLVWGTTEFELLGLHFSVDLELMPHLNYGPALNKVKKILNQWKRRHLSPLGKITVLKTFVVSSFNHIFSSIPSPTKEFISNLNDVMYSFIWDNKPDKINRKQITNTYLCGGLRMIDIDLFIKSQKILWIKRLINNPNAPYTTLFSNISSVQRLYMMGSLWSNYLSRKISNPFWSEVLSAWSNLLDKYFMPEISTISCPLWYNPAISCEPLYFPHWYHARVHSPLDLLDSNDNIMELEDVKRHFNIKTNFLEYTRIKRCLRKYLTSCKFSTRSFQRPYIPAYLKLLSNTVSGSKTFYNIMNHQYSNFALQNKWNIILGTDLDENNWTNIYKVCFKTLKRNDLIWFQFRVIHRILGTKGYQYKIKISHCPTCTFCNTSEETIYHLFVACPKVNQLWTNIKAWLQQDFNIFIDLNPVTIIFGLLEHVIDLYPKNIIILTAKKYIFNCSYKNKELSLNGFKGFIYSIYLDEKYIATINGTNHRFQNSWSPLTSLAVP